MKYYKDYKKAVGQIKLYCRYLKYEHEPRIHLFIKPLESGPSDRRREQIETECRRSGITVTWHEWKIIQRRETRQQLLPIAY